MLNVKNEDDVFLALKKELQEMQKTNAEEA